MNSHYKRAMEAVSLSPEARERIQARMERSGKGRRTLRRLALAAAAAALVFAITISATTNVEGTYPHGIDPAIARSLAPVGLSCTDQGVTITVESAAVKNGQLFFYFTIGDGGSGLLDYGVEITSDVLNDWNFDLVGHTKTSGTETTYGIQILGYDEQSGTYGFLGSLKIQNELGIATDPSGMRAVMSITQLAVGLPDGAEALEEARKTCVPSGGVDVLEGSWEIEFPTGGS